ncbi:hypothetical protein ACQPW3_25275 [Actinosynnema sp. CA-248983]
MAPERSVLVVVHTVTAWNRLADILPVFDSDQRVQLVFTYPAASAIGADVEELLRARGALAMPWDQVVATEFDLALSVHNSGNLHEINAPLVILSHGIGYSKYSARKTENGKRKTENGKRNRSVYGLSAESLVRDGRVVPSAIVLSHESEFERLAEAVPPAAGAAVLGGDPCFDRMAASEHLRREYRSALSADDDTTVVVVSSTWGGESLFGRRPEVVAELLAELPSDQYVVAAVLHPNLWYAHGPHQVRLWLGDCLRAGLRLVPPVEGWQQAVLAADVVVGDHGAVTGYAAALGRPTVLAAFPVADVAEGSAIDVLGRAAPHLDARLPYAPQLSAAADFTRVRALTTSAPGGSADLLRAACYRLMGLPEPDRPALLPPYPAASLVPERHTVAAWWVAAEVCGAGEVRVTRWPADVVAREEQPPTTLDRHLVVTADHPAATCAATRRWSCSRRKAVHRRRCSAHGRRAPWWSRTR